MENCMEIKVYGNSVLRNKSVPVDITAEDIELAKSMLSAMHEAKGVGLAAPQVGVNKRVVVIDVSDGNEPMFIFNPEIYWQSDETEIYEEGCLSLPELSAEVCRPATVRYRYTDENGKQVDRLAQGLEARAILHEVDHLDGVLFIDHISQTKMLLLRKKLDSIKKIGKSQE